MRFNLARYLSTRIAAAVIVASVLAQPDIVHAQGSGTLAVIGEVVPRQGGILAAAIQAPVHRVLAVAGDRVRVGQPLAQLDIADRRADLEIARTQIAVVEAQIGARKAALDVERANLARQQNLRGSAAFNVANMLATRTGSSPAQYRLIIAS